MGLLFGLMTAAAKGDAATNARIPKMIVANSFDMKRIANLPLVAKEISEETREGKVLSPPPFHIPPALPRAAGR